MYKCLVIEDEPLAQQVLKKYIADHPMLQLTGICNDALEAQQLLASDKIAILFLDINLPKLSGIHFLRSLPHPPAVIFTTAYPEFAVEGFDLNAIDYLMKPFSFERFTKAVYKAIDVLTNVSRLAPAGMDEKRIIYIKSDGKNYPVYPEDILYCEAKKNYTMVVLANEQRLMPLISLSKFENVLTEAGTEVLQVHRSFLVSKKHISVVSTSHVTVHKFEIPIGTQYKENFYKAIGMNNQS